MRLELLLYLDEKGCDLAQNQAVCQKVALGAFRAEVDTFGGQPLDSGYLGEIYSVTFEPDGEEERVLGIQKTPTVVFYDQDVQRAVSKLSGSKLTEENVYQVTRQLFTLEADGAGGYIDQHGDTVTVNDLMDGSGKGGFGLFDVARFDCETYLPENMRWMCSALDGFRWMITLMLIVLIISLLRR